MKILIVFSALLFFISSSQADTKSTSIHWVGQLSGDFSFAKRQSIICDAWCYEWAGTNSITAEFQSKDTVICYTAMNEATHCSLHLILVNDSCIPTIVLESVAPDGNKIFPLSSGYIKIDQTLWKKKILKAELDFDFVNDENDKKIFWKGKIYTRIK